MQLVLQQKPPQSMRELMVRFPVVCSDNTEGATLSRILRVNYTDTQTGGAPTISTTAVHAVYVPLLRQGSRRR